MPVYFRKIIQISLVLIAVFSIVNITIAQETVSNSMSSIYLSVSPIHPRAGESVVLSLSSDLLDLDSSKIVWYIDGVARKETASKSVTIKTKTDGGKTTVRVVVETSDGITKETSTEISPGGVDLIIEPMSYSMPFYKGKPSILGESMIKIIALPEVMTDGAETPLSDLNFRWHKDDYVLGSNSGKGKNFIIVNSTIPVKDITVSVGILDNSGNIVAQNGKIITLDDPKVLFYEDSPLYGILYNKAITGSYYLGTREELDVVAKPFSFSFPNDTPANSNYSWYVNDSYVAPNGKANELILKQTTSGISGLASISLNLTNPSKMNQYVNGGFDVQFGQ